MGNIKNFILEELKRLHQVTLSEMAGYNYEEKMTDDKGNTFYIGQRLKDSEGNSFVIDGFEKFSRDSIGVDLRGQGGGKGVSLWDLKYYKIVEPKKTIKDFVQEELKKLHQKTLLEEAKKQIESELHILNEDADLSGGGYHPDADNDCFVTDKPSGGYDVACFGKFVGNFEEITMALDAIKKEMEKANLYPTIWFSSDHGNVWPIDSEGNELKETAGIKALYRNAGMQPPHPGKGIHTKKFHKCVTSVGDEKGKNPYTICMASLGKDKAVKAAHRTDEQINEEYNRWSNLQDLKNNDVFSKEDLSRILDAIYHQVYESDWNTILDIKRFFNVADDN